MGLAEAKLASPRPSRLHSSTRNYSVQLQILGSDNLRPLARGAGGTTGYIPNSRACMPTRQPATRVAYTSAYRINSSASRLDPELFLPLTVLLQQENVCSNQTVRENGDSSRVSLYPAKALRHTPLPSQAPVLELLCSRVLSRLAYIPVQRNNYPETTLGAIYPVHDLLRLHLESLCLYWQPVIR